MSLIFQLMLFFIHFLSFRKSKKIEDVVNRDNRNGEETPLNVPVEEVESAIRSNETR